MLQLIILVVLSFLAFIKFNKYSLLSLIMLELFIFRVNVYVFLICPSFVFIFLTFLVSRSLVALTIILFSITEFGLLRPLSSLV